MVNCHYMKKLLLLDRLVLRDSFRANSIFNFDFTFSN